jgi:hypothetical protein
MYLRIFESFKSAKNWVRKSQKLMRYSDTYPENYQLTNFLILFPERPSLLNTLVRLQLPPLPRTLVCIEREVKVGLNGIDDLRTRFFLSLLYDFRFLAVMFPLRTRVTQRKARYDIYIMYMKESPPRQEF